MAAAVTHITTAEELTAMDPTVASNPPNASCHIFSTSTLHNCVILCSRHKKVTSLRHGPCAAPGLPRRQHQDCHGGKHRASRLELRRDHQHTALRKPVCTSGQNLGVRLEYTCCSLCAGMSAVGPLGGLTMALSDQQRSEGQGLCHLVAWLLRSKLPTEALVTVYPQSVFDLICDVGSLS